MLPGSAVSHSVAVRVKLPRAPPARKAAIEPFSRAVRRAFHEITRRREIIWRYIERTDCWHDARIDLVRAPIEITDELPGNQQCDCVQVPGERALETLSRRKHSQWEAR